jgi:hypothetical protein
MEAAPLPTSEMREKSLSDLGGQDMHEIAAIK